MNESLKMKKVTFNVTFLDRDKGVFFFNFLEAFSPTKQRLRMISLKIINWSTHQLINFFKLNFSKMKKGFCVHEFNDDQMSVKKQLSSMLD